MVKKENREFEIRAELIEEDGKKKFRGVAVPWDTETNIGGWFREVFRKGAFKRVVDEKHDVRGLINHNPDYVLGRTAAGTMTISEGETGLDFEIDPPDTQPANDLKVLVDRGDVSGVSIRFRAVKTVWHEDEDATVPELREIIDADLLELSILPFPQYVETSVELRSSKDEYDRHVQERADAQKTADEKRTESEKVVEEQKRLDEEKEAEAREQEQLAKDAELVQEHETSRMKLNLIELEN